MELKKIFLYVGIAATILFGPFFALGGGAMGCYQAQIDKSPNSESAKNWQLRLAGICMKTLRPEMAAEMYGKFADRHPEDERRPEALWLKAYAHEKADQKREAIDTLQKLCKEHGNHPRGRDADEKLTRQYRITNRL